MKSNAILMVLFLSLLLASCSGSKVQNPQFAFFDSLGIVIDDGMLLGDTLTLPDIYCGDTKQNGDLKGLRLNQDQYTALVVPAGQNFRDEMGKWLLLGVRDMGNGITLAAYFTGSGVGYCVDLITYDRHGQILDAVNARELHLLWRCDVTNPKDDNSFTLDGYFTFDGDDRLTLHRVMSQCLMDYKRDLKGAPQWRQEWTQPYVVNAKGHFLLQGQQLANGQGKVDHYAAMDFRTWDMLVCSIYDTGTMDTWNDYCSQVEDTYDPNYEYNPFPWDVAQLYHMNPQRFLLWMAAHRDQSNRLLHYFKLPPTDRPALLKEIAHMDNPSDRQWLSALVKSWDDTPLTKHL